MRGRRDFQGGALATPTVSFSRPCKMNTAFKEMECCPFLHVSSSVRALLWGIVRLWKGCDAEAG